MTYLRRLVRTGYAATLVVALTVSCSGLADPSTTASGSDASTSEASSPPPLETLGVLGELQTDLDFPGSLVSLGADDDLSSVDGVIVEAGSERSPEDVYERVLSENGVLVIPSPGGAELAALERVTGGSPWGEENHLVVLRYGDSRDAGRRHHWLKGVANGDSWSLPNPAATQTAATTEVEPEASGDTSGLFPPDGAVFGIWSYSPSPASWTATVPSGQNFKDAGDTQQLGWNYTVTLYVYLANGDDGDGDYWMIAIQDVQYSLGTMVENDTDMRSYFNYHLKSQLQLANQDGSAYGSAPLISSSPPSTTGTVTDAVSQTISILADNGQGGTESQQWTATYSNQIELEGWSVTNTSAPNDLARGDFFQSDVWDYIEYPLSDWDDWKLEIDLFEDNSKGGDVAAMPNLSIGSISVQTSAVWQFPSSLVTDDGLKLQFLSSRHQYVVGFANKHAMDNDHVSYTSASQSGQRYANLNLANIAQPSS